MKWGTLLMVKVDVSSCVEYILLMWTDRSGLLHVAFVFLFHLLHVLILLTKDLLEFIYLLGH